MLKTVEISRAKKTKGIAVTYRAGTKNKYGTCPIDCKMNCSGTGTESIDWEYFDALLDAVPSKGVSFTYSHFDPNVFGWGKKLKEGKTVVNFSTENAWSPQNFGTAAKLLRRTGKRLCAALPNIATYLAPNVGTGNRCAPALIAISLLDLLRTVRVNARPPIQLSAADAMRMRAIVVFGGMKPPTGNKMKPTGKN
jgi:hypothetical protein